MKKKIKKKGVNVTLSPEAHKKMVSEAFKAKPRRTLREQGNIINNLPVNL